MLCDICQGIFSHYCGECDLETKLPFPEHEIPHHPTLASLEARKESCQICFQIFETHSERIAQSLEDQSGDISTTCWTRTSENRADGFEMCIRLYDRERYRHSLEFDVTAVKDSEPCCSPTNLVSTDSEASQTQISRWIAKCTKEHSKCASQDDQRWKPSRLLDLSSPRGSNYAQLIRSEEHFQNSPCERYMTLSHCWGNAKFLKLQTDNQASLESGFQLSVLTKTFRDAIWVTRSLGIRYLWIDSLCIVQDNPSDWLSEASSMADVYRRSYCNIGATGAPDGTHGLFFQRDLKWVDNSVVKPSWPQALGKSYIVACSAPRLLNNQFTSQPLLSRAWVLQERILAPRTIHFGNYQIFWECEHLFACQSTPNGITLPKGINYYVHGGPILKNLADPSEYWASIIEHYSRCFMSHPEDKLIALSGVAKHAHVSAANKHDEYLAGIWKSNIATYLLWYCLERVEKFFRTSNYRAPSWSWASVDAKIGFSHLRTQLTTNQLITVESYSITNRNCDTYGQVTAGYLDLRGPFSEITVGIFPGVDYDIFKISLIDGVPVVRSNITEDLQFDDLTATGNCVRRGKLTYALVLREHPPSSWYRARLDGLLLCQDGENNFERVGIFNFYFDTREELEEIVKLFSVRKVRLV